VATSTWSVEFHPKCERWADELDQADAEALLAAVRVLRDRGPALGRPLVDSIVASRHSNMKELRPGSTGRSEVRVLFAFDPTRRAIFLVGGDKSGDWKDWYRRNVPVADDRFDEHLAALAPSERTQGKTRNTRHKGRRR
jgi:hypothetical protein